MNQKHGLAGRIAKAFLHSKLTPLIIVASLVIGAFAVLMIPREEEPQIVVPMLDVITSYPAASPQEMEELVTIPMEKILREIPGIEYVYSTSSANSSLVIARFKVGTPQEEALVKVYSKIYSNKDRLPAAASQPLIKERSIDNVPILALTLWGKSYSREQLRSIAAELEHTIKQVSDVSETQLIGGQPRSIRILVSNAKLQSYGITPEQLVERLKAANARVEAGQFAAANQQIRVEAGALLQQKEDIEKLVIDVKGGRPVSLRDVADQILDGTAEPGSYVLFGSSQKQEYPAVTITVAKRRGTNATEIANAVLHRLEEMRGNSIPFDLNITTTRNYGETAKNKSDELLKHLFIATLSVTLLVALFLGWRESGVVLLAIPVTLALTLAIFYLYGYTLNRVTLFALIFSIGILVDDAIVVVENMVRHFRMPENKERELSQVAVAAIAEVGNPTILATFGVVSAILPMAFVRGLMGPYMRPIPVGASSAMLLSLLVAFIVSPWAALRLLRHEATQNQQKETAQETEGKMTQGYRRVMASLIRSQKRRTLFLIGVVGLFLLAALLVPLKFVRVKMLPFDNKSEFQIMIDMPDGSTLEQTTRVAQTLGQYLAQQPEIANYQIYAGTSGPYNFNGLVRHYYLRQQANQADIQVNLFSGDRRKAQSHEIASRLRPELVKLALPYGARIKVSEVPPGPPVIQTMTAEIYGPNYQGQIELAQQVKKIFQQTAGIVDVDWYVEDPQPKLIFQLDQQKAAQHGITAEQVARVLSTMESGAQAGLLHDNHTREQIPIFVQMTRAERSSPLALESIKIQGRDGEQVSLREIAQTQQTTLQPSIYRKNMRRVIYVTADLAGAEESPVYAILKVNKELDKLRLPAGYQLARYNAVQPESTDHYAMKWDGEWHITIEVFRDLGLAFAAVLVLIYVLVVGWFRSFTVPFVIMAPIPLTLVGILPAHAAMGAFFTATSMIGFIAGAGIIVRNSIILVDFIELRRKEGMPLEEAVVDAGAVRFRPMLLTAAAVVVGASVILFDPIFQGLALSLMAGEVASTLLSRMTVPVLYYALKSREERHRNQTSIEQKG